MQKIGMITAFVIWVFLAVKLISDNSGEKIELASVFLEEDFSVTEADIRGFGEIGVTHMTEQEKNDVIEAFADALGLLPGYEFTDTETDKTSEKVLMKNAKSADIIIKLVSVSEDMGLYIETTHYVDICLDLHENINCATTYRDLIQGVFDKQDIKGTVSINFRGMVEGSLNYAKKNEIANALLEKLDANVVSENRGSDIFTIYAYSDMIEDSVISAGKEININISEEYDEVNNITTIYFSTPFNNLDY